MVILSQQISYRLSNVQVLQVRSMNQKAEGQQQADERMMIQSNTCRAC